MPNLFLTDREERARRSGYAGFACQHCGRDFRVPANNNNRVCCRRSLDEHRFLLEHGGERGVPRRVIDGYVDREEIRAVHTNVSLLGSVGIGLRCSIDLMREDSQRLFRGMRVGIDTSRFDATIREIAHATSRLFQPSPTTLLLRAAKEIICGRLGATRTLTRYDECGRLAGLVTVHEFSRRRERNFRRELRQRVDEMAADRPSAGLEVFMNYTLGLPFESSPRPSDSSWNREAGELWERRPRRKPMVTLSTGVKMEAQMREMEHPEGRFERDDGTRFDLLCMEAAYDPGLESPHHNEITGAEFHGDRRVTCEDKVLIGRLVRYAAGTALAMPLLTRPLAAHPAARASSQETPDWNWLAKRLAAGRMAVDPVGDELQRGDLDGG
jgi:hypothetical protein